MTEELANRHPAVCGLAEVNFPYNSSQMAEELDLSARRVQNKSPEMSKICSEEVAEILNRHNWFISNILFSDVS